MKTWSNLTTSKSLRLERDQQVCNCKTTVLKKLIVKQVLTKSCQIYIVRIWAFSSWKKNQHLIVCIASSLTFLSLRNYKRWTAPAGRQNHSEFVRRQKAVKRHTMKRLFISLLAVTLFSVNVGSLTTPKMPYMMKSMLTRVGVDVFMTGRMELRVKTGFRASNKDGKSGWEQFSIKELHGATEVRSNVPS